MDTLPPYRGSPTREQWLVNETRVVARVQLEHPELQDTNELAAFIKSENLFEYPTEREIKSISKALARRLSTLSNDPTTRNRLIQLIARGTSDQLKQTNLYALARDNRIVWDFLTSVVATKFANLDTTLRKNEIVAFLEGLRTQDEKAASWSPATLNKIRQVLSQCLEQCGMYSRKTEQLNIPLLDYDLENLMRANGDVAILAAFDLMQ